MKANLRYDQLRQLRAGGVPQIQPGIESFSDEVLQADEEGLHRLAEHPAAALVRGARHRAGLEHPRPASPARSPAEYARDGGARPAARAPRAAHAPARRSGWIGSARSSRPRRGVRLQRVRPARAYYYVFPFGRRELERLAYFFDFDYDDGRQPDEYLGALKSEVAHWWRLRLLEDQTARPRLDARWKTPDDVTIEDTRPCAVQRRHISCPVRRPGCYLAADTAQYRGRICPATRSERRRRPGYPRAVSSPTRSPSNRRAVPEPRRVPSPSDTGHPRWRVMSTPTFQRPRLPSHYYVYSEPPDSAGDEVLHIVCERRRVKIKGHSFREFVREVLPRLDGRHTVDAICAEVADVFNAEDLLASLSLLAEHDLLEDAADDSADDASAGRLLPSSISSAR